jgi:hypothetical protein
VGVTATADGETVLSSATLASESYSAEYRPGAADATLMAQISTATGGRGEIEPAQAFDSDGLASGTRSIDLRMPLLLLGVLLWPLAVLLSRLSLRGASVAGALTGARRRGHKAWEALPRFSADPTDGPRRREPPRARRREQAREPSAARPSSVPAAAASTAPTAPPRVGKPAPTASVNELLSRKRARQEPAPTPRPEAPPDDDS